MNIVINGFVPSEKATCVWVPGTFGSGDVLTA